MLILFQLDTILSIAVERVILYVSTLYFDLYLLKARYMTTLNSHMLYKIHENV